MAEHPNPDAEELARFVSSFGHNGALGVELLDFGSDWCRLSLAWREDLVGDVETGILASGPIIALMDAATSIALWLRNGSFRPQATLDMRVDYLRAATPGRAVIARGECYRLTRAIGFVRATAHDGDDADPIANVAATFMFTDA